MIEENIDSDKYWDRRYENLNTPWDIGYANPGLIDIIVRNFEKKSKILIPGAGVGHEAAELHRAGYKNVFTCDWSPHALNNMLAKYPDFPPSQIINSDFFELNDTYDGIVEQTFFCAISPGMRKRYAQQCRKLLEDNGKFLGILFNREFPFEGPPFGGSITEYEHLFGQFFEIIKIEEWRDSIEPRAGSECIVILKPE